MLSKEISYAYNQVGNVKILDLSKEGEITWKSNHYEYNKKTEKIENQISTFITDKLGSATNPNEQLKIFADLKINPSLIVILEASDEVIKQRL